MCFVVIALAIDLREDLEEPEAGERFPGRGERGGWA
jgi:hypothetical protein